MLEFMYSEKATKFCEISTLLFSYVLLVKSKVEILQNVVAFSEYINFKLNFCSGNYSLQQQQQKNRKTSKIFILGKFFARLST